MNKVFKVIWSEARNAYVVVSEMAKNHGTKSCSTKKLLAMLIATGVMTCASVAPVMAAPTVDDSAKVNVGKKAEVNVGENAKVNVNKNAELTLNNGAKVKLGEDAKVEVDKIVAIGNAVSATGGDSVAVGNGAKAEGANGIAIGYKSLSGEKGWGVAVGGNTQATGTFSVALGQTAKALEVEGIAIGHTSLSEGSGAIAIGKNTNAKGAASLALGNDAKALEEASIAFGQGSKSNGNASIAVGRQAKATGANSIAIGNQAVAAQDNSVVIGAHTYNKTTGTGVTGVGEQTQVLGDYSAAFGMKASANKSFTSAIGSSAKATADCANAFGSNSTASAVWSVALGTNSVADRTSGYVGLYAPEDTNSLTWRANGGAVSVGSNGTLTRQITNVAAGTEDTDAVNVAQLKNTNQRIDGVENQVISNTNRINQLGNRVNKVGAGAAALAALHPMDFDPDDKLTFSAGYGNYAGENAAAIGAYYRPDEKVMFSVGGTVGNGENMVNAGISFALDRTNHVSNSRTALAREVIDLRGQLAVMGAKMAKMEKALGMLDETKTKLFPDIPANHWAYEYIAKLAGNGYIEGYPDGNFGGDRLMTRYEFAAMLYRAIENGAALEEKIIKEFEPELGRIRVDRISGEDGDRDKIERVRVNDTKGERDHYGNKLAK